MATLYVQASPEPAAPVTETTRRRYLFGPIVDFLCLGGSALIILPILMVAPVAGYRADIATAMLMLAFVINYPHFAHSYQIFYRNFKAKAFTPALGTVMQARYLLSGIVVPVLLLGFFLFCMATRNVRLLGYGANAMALFVGWHYVKQGYGMLMVDSALKQQYFTGREKKILLVNSYAVWMTAWIGLNQLASKDSLWGIQFFSFALPGYLLVAAGAAAGMTSVATAWMLFSRWRAAGTLPVNGVTAYCVTLYVWLLFGWINPIWALLIPALHSIQYLVVVWRFQTNSETAQLGRTDYKAGSLARRAFGDRPLGHLGLFAVSGIVFGYMGFWAFPILMLEYVPYDRAVFGNTLFLFFVGIFINIHHYFLDNVMWRRENPDAKRYLFS